MARLKVLMLLHDLSRTGAPKLALDAMEGLSDRAEVRFVAADDGPLARRCRSLGPLLLPFAGAPRGRMAWRLERWRRKRAWRELRKWRPDLVYANSVMSLPLASRIDRELGLPDAPMLLHVHELDSVVAQVKTECDAWLTRRPACYVGVSEVVCRRLSEFAGVEAHRVRHVPEFVRESEFESSVGVVEPLTTSDPIASVATRVVVVGGAGSPAWRKNTTLWLQTAGQFAGRDDVVFRWVGMPAGPAGESFRIKRRLLGLEERVQLVSVTDQPLKEFAGFDMFLMTSWEDPFPLVVLENMMLGKPVICLPGGGAPEEVGETGIVVPRFESRDVAQAVERLVADPALRRRLGAAARQRVLSNFTDRVCMPRLWQIMQDTAHGRVGGAAG